jgi:hypothetical protein
MLLSEDSLRKGIGDNSVENTGLLAAGIRRFGGFASRRAIVIVSLFVLVIAASIPGVTRIEVNDNPVR